MKKTLLMSVIFLTGVFAYSQAPDSWAQKADFGGKVRYGAVGFSIGSKGYIGTGANISSSIFYKDFWQYDPATDAWTQKANFGGGNRFDAVGFSIGTKGYIGIGSNGTSVEKDFWEYNPITNVWTQKADFGGGDRSSTIGFSIGNKGYIGLGNGYKDFWEYDPVTDTWTRKADFGGNPRYSAVGFSIGSKGYVGTGSNSLVYFQDFWEYNPVTDKWKQKADFGGGPTQAAVSFSIGAKGYIGTGDSYNSGARTKAFWEYHSVTDTWTRKADFGGPGRDGGTGFSIGDKGYIGTGGASSGNEKDFWEYTPEEDTGCQPPVALEVTFISDTSAVLKWTLPADSVNGFDIGYHIIGSTPMHKRHVTGNTNHIGIGNLLPGTTYRWKMRSDCSADTTKWINGPDFTTLSSTISFLNANAKNLNLTNNTVQIVPNPNKGNFVVQMQLPAKAASTTFTLYNSQSVKVWQQNAGIVSGFVNRNINLESKLSPGVYVLIVQSGTTQLMQKVVVNK